jgi:hypothetical protein
VITLGSGHAQHQEEVTRQLVQTNRSASRKGKPERGWQDPAKEALVGLLKTELEKNGLWKKWIEFSESESKYQS